MHMYVHIYIYIYIHIYILERERESAPVRVGREDAAGAPLSRPGGPSLREVREKKDVCCILSIVF